MAGEEGKGGSGGSGSPPPKTFTEDELNRTLAEKERAWQAKEAELKKKADAWEQHQSASKTEIEKEKEARAKAERELATLKLEKDLSKWRADHGKKNNIPEADWDRLRGTTEDEIKEDAKTWAKNRGLDKTGGHTPPGSGKNGEITENDVMNAAFRAMAKGGSIGR